MGQDFFPTGPTTVALPFQLLDLRTEFNVFLLANSSQPASFLRLTGFTARKIADLCPIVQLKLKTRPLSCQESVS
jgi:hypothetical protein